MEKRILSLFALVALLACGGSPESDLEGTWKLSGETLDAMVMELPEGARAMAKDKMSEMSMSFGDGKCEVSMPGMGTRSGTFTVKSTDGNKLTVETDVDGKKETMVLEMDDDAFSTSMDGKTMKFVRSD